MIPNERDRGWAAGAHLSAVLNLAAAPIGGVIGVLIALTFAPRDARFARDGAREALNFQITYAIASGILAVVALVVWLLSFATTGPVRHESGDGSSQTPTSVMALLVALAAMLALQLALAIVGAVRASRGLAFRYPLAIRFVR
jgi:uncharacterized protein